MKLLVLFTLLAVVGCEEKTFPGGNIGKADRALSAEISELTEQINRLAPGEPRRQLFEEQVRRLREEQLRLSEIRRDVITGSSAGRIDRYPLERDEASRDDRSI